MKDEEWKKIRKKEEEKQLEVCARCVHSIVGANTIECGIGIPQEICPIQFRENHKESEEEE
jgi:hypothetical protein